MADTVGVKPAAPAPVFATDVIEKEDVMKEMSTKAAGRLSGVVVLMAVTLGCGTAETLAYGNPSGAGGTGGGSSSSSGTGGDSTGTGEGGAAGCSGECIQLGPVEWLGPALLWIGKPGEAPECPPSAPIQGSPVFADLDTINQCGTCQCDAPHGTCALPATLTAASAPCSSDGPGVAHTPFDPPAGWSGACHAANPIPANQKCNGVNCVQSLTIAPLTLTESPCEASTVVVPADMPPAWGTAARTCRGVAYGQCATPGELCAPAVEPGFSQCVVQDGDQECPGLYTVKHLFFQGLSDTRSCTPCACGAPVGSTCTAVVTAFKDGSCSSLAAAGVVDATGPVCLDIAPSGQALGSKLAEEAVYAPGACQISGGEPQGEAVAVDPLTYCCLP